MINIEDILLKLFHGKDRAMATLWFCDVDNNDDGSGGD